ncbi:hypothetical protein BVG19_g1563 [[Candida] boidinii]|nr:hypothetical protein BVG19_g1563 [[Candida] boidinii]OWB50310.1 hypothetical protein B5S27_g1859 [[Candida] boidinii]
MDTESIINIDIEQLELFLKNTDDKSIYKTQFEKELYKYPGSVELWEKYLKFLTLLSPDTYFEALNRAVKETQFDLSKSFVIWDLFYDYLISDSGDVSKLELLNSSFQLRLTIPHVTIDSTIEKYSKFIDLTVPELYVQKMKLASQQRRSMNKLVEDIESWEIKLSQQKSNPSYWIEYISWLNKNKSIKQSLKSAIIKGTFERAIEHSKCDNEWYDFWKWYAEHNHIFNTNEFYHRMISIYPMSGVAWKNYLMTSSKSFSSLSNARALLIDARVIERTTELEDFKNICFGLFALEINFFNNGAEEVIEYLLMDIDLIFPLSLKYHDVFHDVEKACIEIYEKLQLIDDASKCVESLILDSFSNTQAETYLYAIDFYKRNNDGDSIERVFERFDQKVAEVDWPERIIQEQKRYALVNMSFEQYNNTEIRCSDLISTIKDLKAVHDKKPEEPETASVNKQDNYEAANIENKKRHQENSEEKEEIESENITEYNVKRRKREPERHPRDREHLSILINPIPEGTTEDDIVGFFKGYAEPRNIYLSGPNAIAEFNSEAEVLTALTRDHKSLNDQPIRVVELKDNILWVTNFPPHFFKKDIENLFLPVVKHILNIRFPSLRSGVNRRFCYIDLVSEEQAKLAVEKLDNKVLEDDSGKSYKLVVKISNPEQKNSRSGPKEENRQLYITNLDFYKVNPDVLLELFSKFGSIEKITLPMSSKYINEKKMNDGYGFIDFSDSESATQALSLNGSKIGRRSMVVELSKPSIRRISVIDKSNKESSEPLKSREEINLKTISIMNLDDKVTSELLLSIVEEVGAIRKLTLRPDLSGAYVEFENASDSGKAAMLLNGKKIGDQTITIGERNDLSKLAHKDTKPPFKTKPSKLFVPVSVLRKKQQKPAKTTKQLNKESTENDFTPEEDTQSSTVPDKGKTNDDFRKMFLK